MTYPGVEESRHDRPKSQTVGLKQGEQLDSSNKQEHLDDRVVRSQRGMWQTLWSNKH